MTANRTNNYSKAEDNMNRFEQAQATLAGAKVNKLKT